jgi:hypothetical protein
MNLAEFTSNRQQYPLEELVKYLGQHVAWSPDGTKIIASDDDFCSLIESIKATGLDPAKCVVSCVPANDLIGGTSA